MITYEKLKAEPHLFEHLTGVNLAKFNELLQKVGPIWLQMNYERLDHPNRQRSVGGGPDYKLKLRDRLLMTLMLLHSYLNMDTLGFFFAVNKSTVSRNTHNILPALYQLNDETSPWPRPPKRGEGKNRKQILQEHPGLREIVNRTDRLER